MKSSNKIAILYFSRTANAEAKVKSWNKYSSQKQNIQIAKILDKNTKSSLQHTGLDVFHSSELNQKGDNFGEKITHAYQNVFDLGYDAIICVGNDCPELIDVEWTKVCSQLNENSSVIGPTNKHGAYLIGMTKEMFDAEKFASLSWQTEDIKSQLIEYFESNSLLLLDEKAELNNYTDLLNFSKKKFSSSYLKNIISRLLIEFIKPIMLVSKSIDNVWLRRNLRLRAPPRNA